MIRFLPSAWLGLLLGLVAWRTRSIFPAMLMHLVNNGLIVLLVAWPIAGERILGPEGEPYWPLVAGGMILLWIGFRLLSKVEPRASAVGALGGSGAG